VGYSYWEPPWLKTGKTDRGGGAVLVGRGDICIYSLCLLILLLAYCNGFVIGYFVCGFHFSYFFVFTIFRYVM